MKSPTASGVQQPLPDSLERQLREALEREAATAEIARVIARSPTGFDSIFAAIAERSNKLVGGLSTAVFHLIDDTLHLAAFTRRSEVADAHLMKIFPMKLSDAPWYDETIREARPVLIEDCEIGFATHAGLLELSRKRGFRSVALIPLCRDSGSIGIISVTRAETGRFKEEHVRLLRTFADHAVIAVENARLFNEVQVKTAELGRSLEGLRAAQSRLVQTEQPAALGELIGAAHEINNPLSLLNNLSAISIKLTDELIEVLRRAAVTERVRTTVDGLTGRLSENLEKVVQQGARVESLVRNMLLLSRKGSNDR